MTPADIRGYANYTPDAVTDLRHMFGEGIIESRPITINGNALWIDEKQRLHRENGLPAVERANGETQYWIHGKLQLK